MEKLEVMYRLSIFLSTLFISACSTTPTHLGQIQKTKDGNEFSIKDTNDGFLVSGHYSEYQFIRNSRAGFSGCMTIINIAARDYAKKKNKEVLYPHWNEIEIIDHGRDILSAIMNVNCRHHYLFTSTKNNVVNELESLKKLYDSGAINDKEYEAAKKKLLGL